MKLHRSTSLWVFLLLVASIPAPLLGHAYSAISDTIWSQIRSLSTPEDQLQALYQHALQDQIPFPPEPVWERWVASVDPSEGESLRGYAQIQMYYLLGLWEIHEGKWEEAQNHFSNSLAQSAGLQDTLGQLLSRSGLGDAAIHVGDPSLALFHYQQAMALTPGDSITWVEAQLLEKLGWLLLSQAEYIRAEALLQQGLTAYQQLGNEEGRGRINALLGDCLRGQQKWDQAIAYYLLSSSQATGYGDTLAIIRSRLNLGKVHQHLGDLEQALAYGRDSYHLALERYGEPLQAEIEAYLAQVYVQLDSPVTAASYANRSLAIAQKRGQTSVAHAATEVLYLNAKANENYPLALTLHEQLTQLASNLNRRTLQSELDIQEFQQQVLLDSLQKATSIQTAQEQLQETERRQRLTALYLGASLVLAVLFGGVIFNRIRLTKRQEAVLVTQTSQIKEAMGTLQRKNTQMLSSIAYAKRIQAAVLPHETLLKKRFPESFLFARPKGIVAGDFFWIEQVGDTTLLAVADCTGHGVPGALVSIKCSEALNRAVYEHRLLDPGQILDQARSIVLDEFSETNEPISDGMDIALCVIRGHELAFAGAYNPFWLFRPGTGIINPDAQEWNYAKITEYESHTLVEIKPDKQPIGRFITSKPYHTRVVSLQADDQFYLFSDGYADQFGGELGKKYQKANFKKLLASMQDLPMEKQPYRLTEVFNQWKGAIEQVDDITVLGVRIA
ncbi:MAG: tetratricopeptide repeat protein [Bacteroidota bacterium]